MEGLSPPGKQEPVPPLATEDESMPLMPPLLELSPFYFQGGKGQSKEGGGGRGEKPIFPPPAGGGRRPPVGVPGGGVWVWRGCLAVFNPATTWLVQIDSPTG